MALHGDSWDECMPVRDAARCILVYWMNLMRVSYNLISVPQRKVMPESWPVLIWYISFHPLPPTSFHLRNGSQQSRLLLLGRPCYFEVDLCLDSSLLVPQVFGRHPAIFRINGKLFCAGRIKEGLDNVAFMFAFAINCDLRLSVCQTLAGLTPTPKQYG